MSPRAHIAVVRNPAFLRVAFVCTLILGCAVVAAPALAGVELIISPAETTVQPGDSFTVELTIPVAMEPFNGYDAILGYDPTVLRLLPEVSSAVREGELMVDACPSNRWNRFTVSPDSSEISITHVLLCAGVNVTGPGVVYRIRFAAKHQLAFTTLEFLEGTRFYDAGILVDSVSTSDGVVQIGQDTNAPPLMPRITIRAVPNPFNPTTVFHFDLPRAGLTHLRIIGVNGRLVREMELGWLEARSHAIPWDGTDEEGRRLASGRYLAHLRHATGEAVGGAVLLK